MSLHIRILIMVDIILDTEAQMFRFLWDGVGEVTAITTTEITVDIAMGGIQGGIVGGIRGGIGERALAVTAATFGWLFVFSWLVTITKHKLRHRFILQILLVLRQQHFSHRGRSARFVRNHRV